MPAGFALRRLLPAAVVLIAIVVVVVVLVGPLRGLSVGGKNASALRRAGSVSASVVAPEAMQLLAGPWDGADVAGALTVQQLSASRLQVQERISADDRVLEATEQVLAREIDMPADYTPAQANDLATFKYLRDAADRGGNIPRGIIIFWPSNDTGPGPQWIPCDGTARTLPDGSVLTPPNLNGRMLKGVGRIADAGGMGGQTSVTLTAAEMPRHTHTVGNASWADGTSTRTTSLAGEHNHLLQQAGFCASPMTQPGSPTGVTFNYCTPNTATTTTDFVMRAATRWAEPPKDHSPPMNEAYTTQDTFTSGGVTYQTTKKDSNFSFNDNAHAHTVSVAHGHTMNARGTAGVMATVPGRSYAGYWMKV
jgi:hypothetical protein